MKIRNLAIAAATVALATTPALSANVSRGVAPTSGESELGGGDGLLFAILATAIIGAFVTITLINNEDDPVSA